MVELEGTRLHYSVNISQLQHKVAV